MKFVRSIVTAEFQESRVFECESRDLTQNLVEQLVEFFCETPGDDDLIPPDPQGGDSDPNRKH